MLEKIPFILNKKPTSILVDPDRPLLWVLRTVLKLTGTKYGCGEGYCGACIVLLDNRAVRSCQTAVKEIKGKELITIEGLATDGNLHPLQKAFMENDALQCGYCTPGMIMNAYALLMHNPPPSYSEITDAMENNLCRCGAHKRIIEAIQMAAKSMEGGFK